MKACQWCYEEKPRSEFGHSRQSEDGLQAACKDCFAANQRKNHNTQPLPPKRRRGPYDIFREKLDELQKVAETKSRATVLYKVQRIREELKL